MTGKQLEARRQAAKRYEDRFNTSLIERMRALVVEYPDVVSPNWISWEGHRFTNAATTKALSSWIDSLS
jgi:hypothetical protein